MAKTVKQQITPSLDLKGLTFIDLFAGIGGFHNALSSYGATCVFSSEMDKAAQDTYTNNYGTTPSGDITQILEKDIPEHDILCAGFPCQAFSISGKQLGFQDTRGTLFFEVARIIKHHTPRFVFLENVKNFAAHDGGKTLAVIKATLEGLGYTVFYKVLNASAYGTPQKRERIYILAFREDLGVTSFDFPKGVPVTKAVRDMLLPAKSPELASLIVTRPATWTVDLTKVPALSTKPLRIGYVNEGRQGERIYHVNGPSITLSAYGGGVGAKTGLYLINGVVRRLAPRECARLLGLPESFKIHPNKNQSYKQFGNSIVVTVLKSILQEVIKQTPLVQPSTSP